MASVLAESWIQIWAQYRGYISLNVYLKRKLFVICLVELNWRFCGRSKLTFILSGEWFSWFWTDCLNRLFASGITQNKYGEIKMRSVGEDDIVWIVDKSWKLPLNMKVWNSAVSHDTFRVSVLITAIGKTWIRSGGSDRINTYNPIPLNLLSF